jgi:CubicO group peptidase (beta-lactamase class C family)
VEFDDVIAAYGNDTDPGHAVGIYRGGDLVATAAAGLAVLEHDVPIGVQTVFDIASASKQFTATCLVLLARDGRLSLDDDVRLHLPELSLQVPVTLRQCLSHTGGLREYLSLCDLAGVPTAGLGEARLMPLLAGQTGVNFGPGTSWGYSNTGFVLAAATVRRLSGVSLAKFAADRLFAPLGMRITHFRDDLEVPVQGLATGYTRAEGGSWHRAEILESVVGDGALVTSIAELTRWQDFMLTGAVLGTAVRDTLLQPAVLADGRELPYALGLEIATVGGHRMYLHSGYIAGFRSVLAYLLDDRIGIAVLANRDDTYPAEIAVRIAKRVLGLPPDPVPARLEPVAAKAAQAAAAGLWYSPDLDLYALLVASADGSIEQVEGDWRIRYAPLADGTWRSVEGDSSIRLRLVADELRYEDVLGEEQPEIYRRVGTPPPASALAGTYYSDELRAYAKLTPATDGPPGSSMITIGLAKPVTVTPVASGEWAGSGLTVRLLDGAAGLEVSRDAARRIPFTRVSGQPPVQQLGLVSP